MGARPGGPTPGARGSGPSAGARPGARAAEPPAPPLVSAVRARSPAPLGRRSGGGGGWGRGRKEGRKEDAGCGKLGPFLVGRLKLRRVPANCRPGTAESPAVGPDRGAALLPRLPPDPPLSHPDLRGPEEAKCHFFGGEGLRRRWGGWLQPLGSEPAKVYKNNSVLCISGVRPC